MPEQPQQAQPDAREDREQQILEAAMAVFAREGFHAAHMEDIARQSGLGKGTLYLYFKSKDAIIGALLRLFFNMELRRLKTLETGQGSIAEQILAYTRHIASEAEHMTMFSSIAYEFYAAAGRDKATRQFFESFFDDYRAVLTRIVQRGIDAGEFQPVNPVNASEIAITLVALLEGLNLLNLAAPQSLHLHTQAEASVRLILDAIRAG